MSARFGVAFLLAVALGGSTAGAAVDPREALERARAEMVRTAREYRASLDPLLALQEGIAQRLAATAQRRREQLAVGIVSRHEVEETEQAAGTAREAVERTRLAMTQADALIAEVEAERQLAALPAPARGEVHTTPTLIRYAGATRWSPAMAPRLEQFFVERFGHAAPMSAFGQTPLHQRLGFDHRNAIDVAVHPDSPEGQALLAWLRQHERPPNPPFACRAPAEPGRSSMKRAVGWPDRGLRSAPPALAPRENPGRSPIHSWAPSRRSPGAIEAPHAHISGVGETVGRNEKSRAGSQGRP